MNELRAQTGVRGLAALTVMATHLGLLVPMPLVVGALSGPAVDLFFTLSGFILCHVYTQEGTARPRGGWRGYHVARFARIYPLYFAVTLVTAVRMVYAYRAEPWAGWPWWGFVSQFTLTFNWPLLLGPTWNAPAWSISVEYFCYLFVFPLCLLAGARWRSPLLAATAATLLSILLVAYLWCVPAVTFGGVQGIARGVVCFAAGAAVCQVYRHAPRLTRAVCRLTGLTVLLCAGLIVASVFTTLRLNLLLMLFWPALVLGLTGSGGWAARLLAAEPFHFLGTISYGIYLIHNHVFAVAGTRLMALPALSQSPALAWTVALGLVCLVILLAWLSYRFLEMPARVRLRRRFGARTAPHAGESALPNLNAPTP